MKMTIICLATIWLQGAIATPAPSAKNTACPLLSHYSGNVMYNAFVVGEISNAMLDCTADNMEIGPIGKGQVYSRSTNNGTQCLWNGAKFYVQWRLSEDGMTLVWNFMLHDVAYHCILHPID